RRSSPEFRSCGSPTCTCRFATTAFDTLPSSVTMTSIYSTEDEVVDWQASVITDGDNIAVSGGHLSLIVNRDVYRAVAETLARCWVQTPAVLSHSDGIRQFS